MDCTERETPAPAIAGNVIDLGEGRIAAIHRLNGSCWVAEFQWGRGKLVDAGSWFRSHAGALRYSHGRRAVALDTMIPISPELSDTIRRLHHTRNPGDAPVPDASSTVLSALWRWCIEMNINMRGHVHRWAGLGREPAGSNDRPAAATQRDPNQRIRAHSSFVGRIENRHRPRVSPTTTKGAQKAG
jgi:hypothetical protein